MSISDHVNAIVGLMADTESLADQAKAKLEQIPAHLDAIQADPENANVGPLIVKALSLRARALGLGFKADLFDFHNVMTESAKLRGIDIPSIDSGGR